MTLIFARSQVEKNQSDMLYPLNRRRNHAQSWNLSINIGFKWKSKQEKDLRLEIEQ